MSDHEHPYAPDREIVYSGEHPTALVRLDPARTKSNSQSFAVMSTFSGVLFGHSSYDPDAVDKDGNDIGWIEWSYLSPEKARAVAYSLIKISRIQEERDAKRS